MLTRLAYLSLGTVFVLSLAAGCSSSTDEEYGSTDDELRTLSATEKVGDIAYGQTEDVAYTKTPTYRALHVAAKANETIDAWVKGDAPNDPNAWIVNAKSTTLVSSPTPAKRATKSLP